MLNCYKAVSFKHNFQRDLKHSPMFTDTIYTVPTSPRCDTAIMSSGCRQEYIKGLLSLVRKYWVFFYLYSFLLKGKFHFKSCRVMLMLVTHVIRNILYSTTLSYIALIQLSANAFWEWSFIYEM